MAIGITIKALAEKIGVSRTTVSRVMAGQADKYRISAKTVQKVKSAAEKYGFVPNGVALNLKMQKTDTIGLMIPDVSNPFFANLASVVEGVLRKQNKLILLCNTNEDTLLESETLSMVTRRQIDGLLVAPVGLEGAHFKPFESTPVVFIDRYFSDLSIPFVATNNEEGAFVATKYLIDKGHTRIACIQGLQETVSNQDRLAGLNRARETYQMSNGIEVLGNGFSIKNGYDSMNVLLQKETLPTAVFTLSNQIAIGAMEAVQERGLKIPKDISLISFDEQPYFKLMSPPVTAISQPIEQIARESIRILMEVIAGNKVSSLLISPKTIERESVANIN